MREIDITQWKQVGEGGNGKTYVNPAEPGVILKVNSARLNTREAVEKEFYTSRAAKDLGLSVPEAKEMVRVGNAYGTITQLIKPKRSLSRICCDEPARIEEMAQLLCARGKELFATPCNTTFFPSRKQQLTRALAKIQFVGKKNRRRIEAFAQSIPESDTCSHGDFQMGNIILSGEQHYWIDLDRLGHGDPMFDIGHLYMLCNVYSRIKRACDLFHMTRPQLQCFWNAFATAYTGKDDHADFDRQARRFACLDVILRYEFATPTLPEKLFFALYIHRLAKGIQRPPA